jgi:hypothetical protein
MRGSSGANTWTTARREEFANNLQIAQLIAVSASSNRSKSDSDPSHWQPPNASVHCSYAREWIWVKYIYGLSLQAAERPLCSPCSTPAESAFFFQ